MESVSIQNHVFEGHKFNEREGEKNTKKMREFERERENLREREREFERERENLREREREFERERGGRISERGEGCK